MNTSLKIARLSPKYDHVTSKGYSRFTLNESHCEANTDANNAMY